MRAPRGHGGLRTVIQLSDENAIAIYAKLTLPGERAPRYGAVTKFFNQLVDAWRAQQALKEPPHGQPQHPAP